MMIWFIETTIAAALLAAIVEALSCILRLPPATRHALWVVVLVKLMTPPLISWNAWTMTADIRTTQPTTEQVSTAAAPRIVSLPREAAAAKILTPRSPAAPSLPSSAETPLKTIRLRREPSMSSTDGAEAAAWWVGWVASAWAVGTMLIVGVEMLRIVRFNRCVDRQPEAPADLRRLTAETAARFRVHSPRVVVTDRVAAPCVWCIGRPTLLWPQSWLEPQYLAKQTAVVAHELAHLVRRDHWVSWLELAARALWWWNPVYWMVCTRIRDNAEEACDAWVVWALPEHRRYYAAALVEACAATVQPRRLLESSSQTAVMGMGRGLRRRFDRRLWMILNLDTPHRLTVGGMVLAGLLGALAAPAFHGLRADPPKAAEEKTAVDPNAAQRRIQELEAKIASLKGQIDGGTLKSPPATLDPLQLPATKRIKPARSAPESNSFATPPAATAEAANPEKTVSSSVVNPLNPAKPATSAVAMPGAMMSRMGATPPPAAADKNTSTALPAMIAGEATTAPEQRPAVADPIETPPMVESTLVGHARGAEGAPGGADAASGTKTVTYTVVEFPTPPDGKEGKWLILTMLESLTKQPPEIDMLIDYSDTKCLRVYTSEPIARTLLAVHALAQGKIGQKGKIRVINVRETSEAKTKLFEATLPPLAR